MGIQHLSLIPQTFKLLFEPLTLRMLKWNAQDYLVDINYLVSSFLLLNCTKYKTIFQSVSYKDKISSAAPSVG